MNGAIDDYDLEAFSDHIYEMYDSGQMSSTQYDELTGYIQNMM